MTGGRVHFSLGGFFTGNYCYIQATSALKCVVVREHKVEVTLKNTHWDINGFNAFWIFGIKLIILMTHVARQEALHWFQILLLCTRNGVTYCAIYMQNTQNPAMTAKQHKDHNFSLRFPKSQFNIFNDHKLEGCDESLQLLRFPWVHHHNEKPFYNIQWAVRDIMGNVEHLHNRPWNYICHGYPVIEHSPNESLRAEHPNRKHAYKHAPCGPPWQENKLDWEH